MHRIAYTKLTEEQIGEKLLAAADGPTSASELSDTFAGTTLRIVTDEGPVLDYSFASEAAVKTWFGVIEAGGLMPPQYRRHHYTDELVGRAITWNYSPGLTSMHLYTTPHSLSWIIFGESGAGGMEWSGPASYVKIRDKLNLAYWLEESCNGTLGTILINMRTMHDCGVGYHCGPDGLRLSAMGAHARHAGRFDVLKYFDLRA